MPVDFGSMMIIANSLKLAVVTNLPADNQRGLFRIVPMGQVIFESVFKLYGLHYPQLTIFTLLKSRDHVDPALSSVFE